MSVKTSRLTVFFLLFSVLTLLTLPISAILPSSSDMELYDGIIRLHVLANSDSDADQAKKLLVRDAVLAAVSELLTDITDRTEAETVLRKNLHMIEQTAADVFSREENPPDVSVTLTEETYPTRYYGAFTLPAGTYTSLRVLIGEAEGANWWCVLFPTLCVGAEPSPELLIEAGLTPSQIRIITGDSAGIKIKFRLLELLSSIFSGS
jgi:stage II sporulation protein R